MISKNSMEMADHTYKKTWRTDWPFCDHVTLFRKYYNTGQVADKHNWQYSHCINIIYISIVIMTTNRLYSQNVFTRGEGETCTVVNEFSVS